MKKLVLLTAAVAAICGVAYAQAPASVIQARQANYKQFAGALKGINDQLRSGSPAIAEIRPRAALLAQRSVQLLRWFPRGTGPEAGVPTRAKAEIWSDHAGFTRAGAAFVVAARTLNAAAVSGDLDRIRAAVPAVQHACGACHETYRSSEH